MGELRTHGYGGWWPMRQFMGKTKTGAKVFQECFRNMVTGEVHSDPEGKGWNGEPPCPTGDLAHVRTDAQRFRENYDLIRWDR